MADNILIQYDGLFYERVRNTRQYNSNNNNYNYIYSYIIHRFSKLLIWLYRAVVMSRMC